MVQVSFATLFPTPTRYRFGNHRPFDSVTRDGLDPLEELLVFLYSNEDSEETC